MKDFCFKPPSVSVNFPTLDLRVGPPATPSLPIVNWTGSNPYAVSSNVTTGHSFGQPSAAFAFPVASRHDVLVSSTGVMSFNFDLANTPSSMKN